MTSTPPPKFEKIFTGGDRVEGSHAHRLVNNFENKRGVPKKEVGGAIHHVLLTKISLENGK